MRKCSILAINANGSYCIETVQGDSANTSEDWWTRGKLHDDGE
jgi:hypothetical protein